MKVSYDQQPKTQRTEFIIIYYKGRPQICIIEKLEKVNVWLFYWKIIRMIKLFSYFLSLN